VSHSTSYYSSPSVKRFHSSHKIKVGGSAVNICVHKSFYDDQCVWKQASNEEAAESKLDVGSEEEAEGEGDSKEFTGTIQFESIDSRHMSNPTVIKARLERLLRHMPNGLHVYRHLLEAIVSCLSILPIPGSPIFLIRRQGFNTSAKKERRVFTHRVHELLKSRFVEKVWAQSTTSSTGRVLCIRLVTDDQTPDNIDVAENGAGDEAKEDNNQLDDDLVEEGADQAEAVPEGQSY
jgi:hypothetical protein